MKHQKKHTDYNAQKQSCRNRSEYDDYLCKRDDELMGRDDEETDIMFAVDFITCKKNHDRLHWASHIMVKMYK